MGNVKALSAFLYLSFQKTFPTSDTASAVSTCVRAYVCKTHETFVYNSVFTAVSINRDKLIFCK